MISTIVTLYENYNVVLMVIFMAGLIALLVKGQFRLTFMLVVCTFFFKNFSFELFSSVDIWKLTAIPLMLYALAFRQKRYYAFGIAAGPKNLFVAWQVYTLIASLMFIIVNTTEPGVDKHYAGFFSNEGRILTQTVYYLLLSCLFFLPIAAFDDSRQLITALRWAINSIVMLAMLGILQKLIYDATGVDIFPINRAGIFDRESGYFYNIDVSSAKRINSLAGEPKHLAIACVFGLSLIVYGIKYGFLNFRLHTAYALLLLITIYFTFSTTGLLLLLILAVYTLVKFSSQKNMLGFVLVILALTAAGYYSIRLGNVDAFIFTLEKTGLEVQDQSIMSALLVHPFLALFGTGAGNIHHFAVHYLPVDFPIFKESPYKGNSGLFFVIADSGIIGAILLLLMVTVSLRNGRRISMQKSCDLYTVRALAYFYDLVLISSACFLFRYSEIFFLMTGMYLSLLRSKSGASSLLEVSRRGS